MRTRTWIAIAIAVLILAGGVLWITRESSQGASADDDGASWLFSLAAEGGTMEEGADGTYRLTLTGIDDPITAFTDRPDRDAGLLPLERAVQSWPQVFADAAPNAVLIEHTPTGDSDSFVVVLTNPTLVSATSLAFDAALVPSDVEPTGVNNLYPVPPRAFRAASLFIDDVQTTTVNFPPRAVCMSTAGSQITPPGSVTKSSETGAFDQQCKDAGGHVTYTEGEYQTIP